MTNTYTCAYDSWNRLVEVKSGETTVGKYEYDGRNRRIKKHIDSEAPGSPDGLDTYRHFYYNTGWQILETRESASENTEPETLDPEYQYVWSKRYIDSPVLRDENKNSDGDCTDAGVDERVYYLTDANMNVTCLVDTNGDALERYIYDPYGKVTVLDADWSADADGKSDYANSILYCGYRYDPETGLYHVRRQHYHPRLGRWSQRDPMGYVDGMSLYEYVGSNPNAGLDPQGTDFIAISDRSVGGLPFYHYGLQYWRCPCPWKTLNYTDGYTEKEIKETCNKTVKTPKAKQLGAVELKADGSGWIVWAKRLSVWRIPATLVWDTKTVWISHIVYSNEGNYDIMPIFDSSPAKVAARWRRILAIARTYKWAEQPGYEKGVFKNWPRSMYKSKQSNSNTFVIYTVEGAGLTMVDMDGSQPGNQTPSQNTDTAATGGPWYFYPAHTPWHSKTGKPKPNPGA